MKHVNANAVAALGIQKGDIVRIDYLQPVEGGPRRIGKVVDIRDTERNRITDFSYRRFDKTFRRSRNLITILDSRGHFRKFYLERSSVIKKPFLGKIRYAIASWFWRNSGCQAVPSGHER